MNEEITHAYLERHHYRAVQENQFYALMGMLDVEKELEGMNSPLAPDLSEVEDRIGNLEAISAQPGKIPRQYHNSLQQLQGQVVFLQNALNAALDRGKEKAKQQAEKWQTKKSTYKGLTIEPS